MSRRRADLALNIVHNLKLKGVLQVRYRFDGVDVKTEHVHASTVHLNVKDLEAQAEAYDAIATHEQLVILDHICEDGDNGTTEYLVVGVHGAMRAQAHINHLDLTARIVKREVEAAQHAKLANATHAKVADRFLTHLIGLETERELWGEVAKDGDMRRVFALALANLCMEHTSGTLLEQAIHQAQNAGYRRFVERGRTYTSDDDATEAILSI